MEGSGEWAVCGRSHSAYVIMQHKLGSQHNNLLLHGKVLLGEALHELTEHVRGHHRHRGQLQVLAC